MRRNPPLPPCSARSAQSGVTLVVVMLILIVVTVLGIGGTQLALLGERSTRYDRDYMVASQAAEAALKDAEADIAGTFASGVFTPTTRSALFKPENQGLFVANCGTTAPSATSNQGLCQAVDDTSKPVWATVDFTDTSNSAPTVAYAAFTNRTSYQSGSGIQPELAPRYIVEMIDDRSPGNAVGSKMYRVTAIGFGPRKQVQVVMQTAFRKPQ